MSAGARRRFGLGILANGFARLNTTIIQLAGLPLFLAFWGTELYGEWLILTTIPVYLMLSDVGFSAVAQNEMAIQASSGDTDKALKVFHAAFLFIGAIFIVVSLLIVTALWYLPFENWLNLSRLQHFAAWSVLVWFMVKLAASQFTALLVGVFRSAGHYPRAILLNNIVMAGQFLITAAALYLGMAPVGVAALEAAGTILAMVGFWIAAKRLAPWLGFSGMAGAVSEIRRLIRPSFAFFGYSLSFALTLQGSTTMIGVLLGPEAIVVFNTIRTLTRVPQQAVEMICNSVWAEFSLAHGAGDTAMMRRLHRQAIGLNVWSVAFICLLLVLFGKPVYEVWTRGEVAWHATLFAGMLLVVVVNMFHFASAISLVAVNRHEPLSIAFLVSAIASLAMAVPLIQAFGLTGMAFALIADGIVRFIVSARAVRGLIDDRLADIVRYVLIGFWPGLINMAKSSWSRWRP